MAKSGVWADPVVGRSPGPNGLTPWLGGLKEIGEISGPNGLTPWLGGLSGRPNGLTPFGEIGGKVVGRSLVCRGVNAELG